MNLRKLLFPFSLPYGLVVSVRNFLFDKKMIASRRFPLPVISVGNLSAGGTGKTPQVEYLLRLLGNKAAVLSRGYGRKTKGFRMVEADSKASEVGDEPLQYKMKFPQYTVAVCESRTEGIEKLMASDNIACIILDDAFQHRYVSPSLNLLLTTWNLPYFRDSLLPAGMLRESAKGAARADAIIVTKCPADITDVQKQQIIRGLNPLPAQQVFFSCIKYGTIYNAFSGRKAEVSDLKNTAVLMLAGIADASRMRSYLEERAGSVVPVLFPDHYEYNSSDIISLERKFDNIAGKALIITTEKDFARLKSLVRETLPLYILPVETDFTGDDKTKFDQYILNHVAENQ